MSDCEHGPDYYWVNDEKKSYCCRCRQPASSARKPTSDRSLAVGFARRLRRSDSTLTTPATKSTVATGTAERTRHRGQVHPRG